MNREKRLYRDTEKFLKAHTSDIVFAQEIPTRLLIFWLGKRNNRPAIGFSNSHYRIIRILRDASSYSCPITMRSWIGSVRENTSGTDS